nr:hypothetical protein [Tanacetum cinerariifolium]
MNFLTHTASLEASKAAIYSASTDEVRVVKVLHGEDGKIGKKVQPRYPSTWLNIINEIESLKLHGIDLVSFITPKLGNGANTSFWDVAWCGDIAFKNLVPRLYALESMKNIEVASKLSHGDLEFSFRRNPRGGVEQNSNRESIPMQEKLKLSKSQGASTPTEVKRMQNVSYASAMGFIIGDLKGELRLSYYTDAGYLTDADNLKSQTGYVFVLNGGVVD